MRPIRVFKMAVKFLHWAMVIDDLRNSAERRVGAAKRSLTKSVAKHAQERRRAKRKSRPLFQLGKKSQSKGWLSARRRHRRTRLAAA